MKKNEKNNIFLLVSFFSSVHSQSPEPLPLPPPELKTKYRFPSVNYSLLFDHFLFLSNFCSSKQKPIYIYKSIEKDKGN